MSLIQFLKAFPLVPTTQLAFLGVLSACTFDQPHTPWPPAALGRNATIEVQWSGRTTTSGPHPSEPGWFDVVQPPPESCEPVGWYFVYDFAEVDRPVYVKLPISIKGPLAPQLSATLGPDPYDLDHIINEDGNERRGFVLHLGALTIPTMDAAEIRVEENTITIQSDKATVCDNGQCTEDIPVTVTITDNTKPIYRPDLDWPQVVAPRPCWEHVPIDGMSRVGDLPLCWAEIPIEDCDTGEPGQPPVDSAGEPDP